MNHTVSISTLKNHIGDVLDRARNEPVTLERFGKPIAVIVPYHDYQQQRQREDAYWYKLSQEALNEGMIGHEATQKLMLDILSKSHED